MGIRVGGCLVIVDDEKWSLISGEISGQGYE